MTGADLANKLFDWAIESGKRAGRRQVRIDKMAQIRDVLSHTCGNCQHWMKNQCVPEKKHGQFRNMNSFACSLFQRCWSSKQLFREFKREYRSLELVK